MALMRLDKLPMEILQAISHFLDGSREPSVANFSLVNRICCRATASVRFRTLKLEITDSQRLFEDARRWNQMLLANDSHRHVREVMVAGSLQRRNQKVDLTETNMDASAGIPESLEDDAPWIPLAELLRMLSGLKDLYILVKELPNFPSCLLKSLSEVNLSNCRLHFQSFCIDDLRESGSMKVSEVLTLAPKDAALLQSPNLYSFTLTSDLHRTPKLDQMFDAVMELIARACPALRELEVEQTDWGLAPQPEFTQPYPKLRLDYNEFPSMRAPGTKLQLTSLSVGGIECPLQKWQHNIDFTVLQKLNIDADFQWAAVSAHFPALSQLLIEIEPEDEPSVAQFLSSLPPLQSLSISGTVDESTMLAIEQTHGAALESLSISTIPCSIEMLTSLGEACPRLTYLTIRVPRTQGDASEVAIYTTLGTFPQLQHLHIIHDCTIDADERRHVSTETKIENIKNALVNCAIDGDLVASIRDKITTTKVVGSAPLRIIWLDVINAGNLLIPAQQFESYTYKVYQSFTKRWKWSGYPEENWIWGPVVTEEQTWLTESRRLAEEDPVLRLSNLPMPFQTAFRQLWPGDGEDWTNEWKSFPLQ